MPTTRPSGSADTLASVGTNRLASEFVPRLRIDVRLVENTSKGAKGTSWRRGTITVSVRSGTARANFTWLPFWLTSSKPADSRRRLISRKPSGLSRPNLYLDLADYWRMGGNRRLEVQFQRLTQILDSLFFSSTLAGNIDIQALGNEPFSLAPDGSRKRTLHGTILAQSPADEGAISIAATVHPGKTRGENGLRAPSPALR